jgi:hypothetical protein
MMPEWGVSYALMAAAYGQLGRFDDAQPIITKLHETGTDSTEYTPETWLNFHIPQDVVDSYRLAFHNVGLDFPYKPVDSHTTE